MNTYKIVTIKPEESIVEYKIIDENGNTVSHGHQVVSPVQPGAETTGAQLNALVEQDCYIKGLLPPPENWVATE